MNITANVKELNDKELLDYRSDLECYLINLDIECGDLTLYDINPYECNRDIRDVYEERYFIRGKIYETNRELIRRGLIEMWMRI